jgi:uncharacterized membrane protein
MSTSAAQRIFTEPIKARLKAAIMATELKTSGEVCVYVEDHVGPADVWVRAQQLFDQLGLTKTMLRNGVLLYLAVGDRRFAILGDAGIDQRVPDGFWDAIRDDLQEHFRREAFIEGMERAIGRIGDQLALYFPRAADDINELPDEIHVV